MSSIQSYIGASRFGRAGFGARRFNEPAPPSVAAFFDLPAWERPTELDTTTTSPPPRYRLSTMATSGTVTITIDGTAIVVAYNISAAALETAMEAALGEALTCTGTTLDDAIIVQFDDRTAENPPEISVSADVLAEPAPSEGATQVYAATKRLYRIEAYLPGGEQFGEVVNWTGGEFIDATNQAGQLRFRVLGSHPMVPVFRDPRARIRLRDRWGFVLAVFRVTRLVQQRDSGGLWADVEAQTLLRQLQGEVIDEYRSTPGQGKTVGSTIAELLAAQINEHPIGGGTIDTTIANQPISLDLSDSNILAALREMQRIIPGDVAGFFYVDAQSRLNWRLAQPSGETITLGERLHTLEYEWDTSELYTRVYAYGEGNDPETRLTLTDAGEANDYIERNTGTYGVWAITHTDGRVKHGSTLLAMANKILDEHAEPRITLRVTALDLAKAESFGGRTGGGWDSGWNDLYVAQTYQVVDSGAGVSSTVSTERITYDLASPLAVTLDLRNSSRSLSDTLDALLRSQHRPLDVDGDRYPTMGRNYSSSTPDNPRAGDVRYNTGPEMHNGTEWEELASEETNTVIRLVKLTDVDEDDYLAGNLYDASADTTGELVYVAKPYYLRKTPFDGETITYNDGSDVEYIYTDNRTRTADDGTDTEIQYMTPDYYVDEIITVMAGGTGVNGGDGEECLWVDLNSAGRTWAAA